MIGRGHGSAFLRLLGDRLLAQGAPALFIDPDPRNAPAIRAYGKAGFVALHETQDAEGETVLLMLRRPPQDKP
jgi:aminoglycoside 6'-N-acetyltransferase